MSKFNLFDGTKCTDIIIEESAFDGVKEIGKTVAEDICLVTGIRPQIIDELQKDENNPSGASHLFVLFATVGKSGLLDELEANGSIDLSGIRGKREVFMLQVVETEAKLLVIAGSDKRGTIYGMFHLSEMCGVSPLVYFGDAYPEKKDVVELEIGAKPSEAYISKEPSVFYRGFFINDEWPAFGNWATEKFGGVNAKCYRKIFELLLRMKGNYMWPAMWNSNFSEDGPGIENARLADELGVVMGTSHHEPLFRAGNEWQQQYRNYGDDNSWSFISNGEAITRFWEDGVRRNKDFENVITIGMRGEADSKLLPEDATMKDNIEVVKKAILAQDNILSNEFKGELKDIPRMLAIYKEVEDYYYGDETCEGLKDWDELKDVIFLLSDDNHGNLRNLPTEAERKHPGGYGMYYHFDYHGAPISYEWTNCNRLTKTWEQMTTAYEAGVCKMWIVNVGDLKEMEYPLSFFMDLAYDYETYGLNGLNKIEDYVDSWIDRQFGRRLTNLQKADLKKVLEGYTRYNSLRTPETMNERIYHPVHFREGERILEDVRDILDAAHRLKSELTGEALLTYESMVYYAAAASLNLVIAWILTGMNHELARRGLALANVYTKEIEERIAFDKKLVKEFHEIADGKWNHCLSSAHTGFRSWDDREWAYPAPVKVTPISGAKALVGFRGYDRYHLGAYWQDMGPIVCDDFVRTGAKRVLLDIASRGDVAFEYSITLEGDALKCSSKSGHVEVGDYCLNTVFIELTKELSEIPDKSGIKGRVDISFDNGQKTYVDLLFTLDKKPYICVSANDFKVKADKEGAGFEIVKHLGREDGAIKVFPPMARFEDSEKAPFVSYDITADEDGEYDVIFYLLTRNPYFKGGRLSFFASVNGGEPATVHGVSDHYYTEWQDEDWAQGVLRGGRCVDTNVYLNKGHNEFKIYAGDPGVIIEKFVIKRKDYRLPDSYLGPSVNY